MTIQIANGSVEVTPQDKVHVINGCEFVIKIRKIGEDAYLVLGWNHGSGWSDGVFAMNDALPSTGDAHAILAAALPAINTLISQQTPGGAVSTDFLSQLDRLIQSLQVVNGKVTL